MISVEATLSRNMDMTGSVKAKRREPKHAQNKENKNLIASATAQCLLEVSWRILVCST